MSEGQSPGWYRPELLEAANARRRAAQRRRTRAAVAVSLSVTVVWALYVVAAGHGPRVARNWEAAVTMVFGSFVAGSTPQGSGAIAFPVFTKLLEVPSDVARTFSLCIQTVGMGSAAAAILLTRRLVEWRAVAVGGLAALAGFLGALFLLGDPTQPFWTATIPAEYVRVTFSLVLAAMAFVVFLSTRVRIRKVETALPDMNARMWVGLVVAGVLGGLSSALVGSGADVFVYLLVVVLFGIDPKVGVPTSVLVMAAVSGLGLVVLGVVDGQLAVELAADGQSVVAVGGAPVTGAAAAAGVAAVHGSGSTPLPAARFDLFGLWLASVPVVAWGAPLGSWVTSRLRSRHLVYFVAALAVAELLTTALFMEALRRPGPLLTYAVAGLAVTIGGLSLLARYRQTIFGLPGLDLEQSLSAEQVDAARGYERQLRRRPRNTGREGRRGPVR